MTEDVRKTAGVMGGMGPDATVDFMAKVIALTDSGSDQDHVHMIVDQDPSVPNRQRDAGADFLVLVCNTAHVFLDAVHANTSIPFISIIDESINEIDRICPDARQVGVMATDGCLDTGIYQDAITASGRTALVPEGASLEQLMSLITAIKAGNQGEDIRQAMQASANALVDQGADVIIAGCTEIPIVFDGENCKVPVIGSTNVLAQRTLDLAKGVQPLPGKQ
jgi:aspartate racemase